MGDKNHEDRRDSKDERERRSQDKMHEIACFGDHRDNEGRRVITKEDSIERRIESIMRDRKMRL